MGNLAFESKRMTLVSLLEKAAMALPTRDMSAILKNFQFQVFADKAQVIATNLELSVVASTTLVKVTSPGVAVFPARRLMDLVKEAEEGDAAITVQQDSATIEIGRTTWELRLMDASEYPAIADVSEVTFHKVDRLPFYEALEAVRYAAAVKAMRPQLMLVDVKTRVMRAADGVRYQQVHMPWWPEGLDLAIPIHAVPDLLRLLKDAPTDEIGVGDSTNHLVFEIGPDVFIASKATADFPPVEESLVAPAKSNPRLLGVDRQQWAEAVRRVRVAADPQTSGVAMLLRENEMVVHARDKFGNQAEETVDVHWDDSQQEVAFNATHLLEMLAAANGAEVEFRLGKDTKTRKFPLLMQDGQGFLGVLNQLRLEWVQ